MTTISRGLVTIKHFRTTFAEALQSAVFSGVFRNGTELKTAKKVSDFTNESRKSIQSIKDKLESDFNLRCKINKANSENYIEIDGRKMTISDALTYRQHILPQLKVLHLRLIKDLQDARKHYTVLEREYAAALASAKDDTELKTLVERREKPSILDIQSEIDSIKSKIDFFDLEFDAILTETNPLIKID